MNNIPPETMRALYRKEIEQIESQRAALAAELHGEILNSLINLKMRVDGRTASQEFFDQCDRLIGRFRQTVRGLRPAMLNYGLRFALQSLVDELSDTAPEGTTVWLEAEAEGAGHERQLELHIYRITQLACENALKHGRPKTLVVRGCIEPGLIELTVEDDGLGFEAGAALDLAHLVSRKQYGLASMFARASLIGAEVSVDSAVGAGTRVRIVWRGL